MSLSHSSPLPSPRELRETLPLDPGSSAAKTVETARAELRAVLAGEDKRLLVIIGPCSIHSPAAAREYAKRLAVARADWPNLLPVMRLYFEKPRTYIGWKGLVNDPYLDASFDLAAGLRLARQLLLEVNAQGVAAATEFLEPFTPRYLADLVSWAAIGARTVESQTHRQLASGLPMPVGFKNPIHGRLDPALYAIQTSRHPHHFLDIDDDGRVAVSHTRGNDHTHLVLRGSDSGPNYSAESVREVRGQLTAFGEEGRVLIDCSHGNSGKQAANQPAVARAVLNQWRESGSGIIGLMLESDLYSGKQKLEPGRTELEKLSYGVSVTDECLGWEETAELLNELNNLAARG